MRSTLAIARQERFDVVGSTNDVVREWLASGTPEICLAVADVQSAGRGREGRRWEAPSGAALLLSLGFRPTWLEPDRVWRLAATASLAMADAAEEVAGLGEGVIRLKWPNDLVVETAGPHVRPAPDAAAARATLAEPAAVRKLGGVLGESGGLGGPDPQVVVGIGVNVGWARSEFPAELADAMTSLAEVAGGRPVDRDALLERFADRLEVRIEALRMGYFDVAGWVGRQATTGREVVLRAADDAVRTVRAVGVDALSGALLVEDPGERGGDGRPIFAGDVVTVRLAGHGAGV